MLGLCIAESDSEPVTLFPEPKPGLENCDRKSGYPDFFLN